MRNNFYDGISSGKFVEKAQSLSPLVRDVAEIVPGAFLLVDSEGIILFANHEAEPITGYSVEDLLGSNIDKLIPDQVRGGHASKMNDYIGSKKKRYLMGERSSIFLQTRSGVLKRVGISLNRYEEADGPVFGVHIAHIGFGASGLRDSSDESRALERIHHDLELVQKRFSMSQRLTNAGSWDWDIIENRLYWSDQVFHIFGVEKEDMEPTYEGFLSFVHEDDRENVDKAVQASLSSPSLKYDIKHRIVRCDGMERMVREVGIVELNRDGEPAMMMGSVQDITEIEQMEEATRAALRRELEASRTKSEFLANLSHELRTPLNVIIGFSEMFETLKCTESDYERALDYGKEINAAGKHLNSLVSNILEVSRVDIEGLELDVSEVDFRQVVKVVHGLINVRAMDKGIGIIYEIEAGLPLIEGDRVRVQQMLLNLVTNSVKYTDTGGRITVAISQREDSGIRMSVEDNGKGMDPDQINKALEEFSRLETAYTSTYQGGLGLGLSLTKSLCDLHDADLKIESEVGKGTLVTIDFPVSRTVEWNFI